MATPTINNGIFLRDNQYVITNHIDKAHITTLLKSAPAVDLGPVDLFAFAKKKEAPLYTFASFNKNNIIYVNHPRGEYTWQTPIAVELPYIVNDVDPTNTKKGIAGTPFKLKFNKRAFSHNEIITYDKFNGIEVYITEDDIYQVSDGFIYTCKLVNNDNNAYLDNKYLANGTVWFSIGSIKGEFTEKFADFRVEAGYREFYNYVGTGEASVQFSISSEADAIAKGLLNSDGRLNVTEIWRVFDSNIDPSITDLNSLVDKMGVDYVKNLRKNGKLSYSFVTKIEAMMLSKIMRDHENYLMWGKGGRIQQNFGADDIRMTVGLWQQLNRGYKFIYTKDSFSLDIFRAEIFNFFAGKVDFEGPDPNRRLLVHTGLGGFQLVQNAIAAKIAQSGMQVQAATNAGIGAIQGSPMNLNFGYAYSGITFPFLANVTFVINPAFDNYNTNDIENPKIDGFNLSHIALSYLTLLTIKTIISIC